MIGVFDSGLGGLSVLAAIARALPRADLTYLADTAFVPYGARDDDFIRERVLAIGRYLRDNGCDMLVVACNTATAAAVEALRRQHPEISVVGVEPGVKPAAAGSRTGRIAVLATESTAKSGRLKKLIREHAGSLTVHIEACPGWATRVEMLNMEDPDFTAEAAEKIMPLLDAGVDRLVLGCTHYSFLAPALVPLIHGRAEVVDVATPVAQQVTRLAADQAEGNARLALLATASAERLQAALPRLGLDWLLERSDSDARLIAL